MPLDSLTEEQIQQFHERGTLHSSITIPIVAVQKNAEKEGHDPDLSEFEKNVYDRVLRDLERVGNLLEQVIGVEIDQCPLDRSQGAGNYFLTRKVLYDHNLLEITKSSWPDFYWRVAIRDSGEPEHAITGFYHGCSSGNFGDIRDAFYATQHLFPRVGSKLRTGAIHKTRNVMS